MKLPTLLTPWQTLALLGASLALAACEPNPSHPPTPKAGPDAAAVAPVSAPAPGQALAAATVPAGGAAQLSSLRDYLGSYPHDTVSGSYLEQGVLADRLRAVMGEDYPSLLANLRTVGPLTDAGSLWFLTGNRPHEGGVESAAIVIDPAHNALRVWLQNEGRIRDVSDPAGAQIGLPPDVKTFVDNAQAKPAA